VREGPLLALTAALLFGASSPIAKLLLGGIDPILLAALLYLGSGVGLSIWRFVAKRLRASAEAPLARADFPWLAGAVLAGGVVAPVLLMVGLAATPASTASLLLNLEGVLTAAIAWLVFRENFDRRIVLGMVAIVAGGALLSWSGRAELSGSALLVVAACAGWAIDNNLTRKISAAAPVQIAMIKGLAAGVLNLSIAMARGAHWPPASFTLAGMALGLVSYGLSLVLFIRALRLVGTARTSAYFSTAPFAGAVLALVLLRESATPQLAVASLLMALGVWLHLSERHVHLHTHELLEHAHLHVHDEHHQHEHSPADPPGEPHAHPHRHEPLTHSHPHYPDIHHRHPH
jgi:drug/metabolite transporter (DMT)-like permease